MVAPRVDWSLHWVVTAADAPSVQLDATSVQLDATSVQLAVVGSSSDPATRLGWVGIGFSPTGRMPGSDAVVTWNGEVKAYALNGYTTARVVEHPQLTLTDTSLTHVDGKVCPHL